MSAEKGTAMEGGGLTSEDHDDRMHILFEPFNDTECLFEDGIADVPARLVLCFGEMMTAPWR